jgi:hypothetical protein
LIIQHFIYLAFLLPVCYNESLAKGIALWQKNRLPKQEHARIAQLTVGQKTKASQAYGLAGLMAVPILADRL